MGRGKKKQPFITRGRKRENPVKETNQSKNAESKQSESDSKQGISLTTILIGILGTVCASLVVALAVLNGELGHEEVKREAAEKSFTELQQEYKELAMRVSRQQSINNALRTEQGLTGLMGPGLIGYRRFKVARQGGATMEMIAPNGQPLRLRMGEADIDTGAVKFHLEGLGWAELGLILLPGSKAHFTHRLKKGFVTHFLQSKGLDISLITEDDAIGSLTVGIAFSEGTLPANSPYRAIMK